MSGGHWDYLSQKLEDSIPAATAALEFLAAAEHELDWGICSDTCRACSKLRMAPALELLFDHWPDAKPAIAMVRDQRQNQCDDCAARDAKRARDIKQNTTEGG